MFHGTTTHLNVEKLLAAHALNDLSKIIKLGLKHEELIPEANVEQWILLLCVSSVF